MNLYLASMNVNPVLLSVSKIECKSLLDVTIGVQEVTCWIICQIDLITRCKGKPVPMQSI